MPTYLNESDNTYTVEKAGSNYQKGATVNVAPGVSVETDKYYDLVDFTKTSDSPLKNRIAANTAITLATEEADHDINAATRKWMFIDITTSLTVKPQLTTATEILLEATSSSPVIIFDREDYPCEKLIVSGSGTCKIVEFKW